jgi:hypothetical protein
MDHNEPVCYWWLSFVDRIDDGDNDVACHLGITIVTARGFSNAVDQAWNCDCNPGGEVLGQRLPDVPLHSLPRQLTYRLLTDPGAITAAQFAVECASPNHKAQEN